jgi:phosphoglycolate phosphatase
MGLRRPALIVFDLDGTLLDSAPDIAHSVDIVRERFGLAPAGLEQVRRWIGNGQAMLVKRALTGEMWPQQAPPQFEVAQTMYLEAYDAHKCERSALFPGVAEGLAELRADGYRMACVTNKSSKFTGPLLEHFGIAQYFEWVGGGDDFGKLKPDPEPLLRTAEKLGTAPAASLMVGDSANDAKAARRAGFMLVCVAYGYHGDGGVEALQPDAIIEKLTELPALLGRPRDSAT